MSKSIDPLQAITSIDGRYHSATQPLAEYCSEQALMQYRIMVEVEYLLALASETKIKEVRRLTKTEQAKLRNLYEKFTLKDAQSIKKIEATTKHDVKAIEYYIKQKLERTSLKSVLEFVHFGLTSEDVNNLAYTLILRDALGEIYVPAVQELVKKLRSMASQYATLPMLSLTHGQPATPTTLGKELKVFVDRLYYQLSRLATLKFTGKFSGATGTFAAHKVAYPNVNWPAFAKKFVTSSRLEYNAATTQIEPHDRIAEAYQSVARINTIIKDFDQDMWLYISRGLFGQQNKAGEIGSSAMPHKINPIWFENSEGNIGIANALLYHMAEKLPVSRMQRDLTDSTVLRNQGTALAHSLLAVENTLQALERVKPNKQHMTAELESHWEVLAEPIQTVMRRLGKNAPYEQLKKLTRGVQLDQTTLHTFIDGLDIPAKDKLVLKKLTPTNYIGYAKQIAQSKS